MGPNFLDRYEKDAKAVIAFTRIFNGRIIDQIVDNTLHQHSEVPILRFISNTFHVGLFLWAGCKFNK